MNRRKFLEYIFKSAITIATLNLTGTEIPVGNALVYSRRDHVHAYWNGTEYKQMFKEKI